MLKNGRLVVYTDAIFGMTLKTVEDKGVYFIPVTPSPYKKGKDNSNSSKCFHLRSL